MEQKSNRRQFFVQVGSMLGLALVAPAIFGKKAMAEERRRGGAKPADGAAPAAGGGMPMLDAKDPTAKAVKYVEDHKKAPEAKGNHCATCGFYAKKETRNGKEAGTCTIFAGKLVYADAWCTSWNKKA